MFGLKSEYRGIMSVFEKLGYSPNVEFNLGTETRLQFVSSGRVKKADVFLDKFRMEHTLDFRQRIRLDDLSIPITDLLLTKLQMEAKLEVKDAKDIVAILEDHDLGHDDSKEVLNQDYMADLCSRDWGLYKTVTNKLQIIRRFIEEDVSVQCIGMEASELARELDIIHDSIVSRNKGLRWKTRNILGERMKWYEEVEAGGGEVH